MPTLAENLKAFQALKTDLYQKDFLLTWQHPEEELRAIVTLADTLKGLHKAGKSFKAFDTGLAISIFRDNSTRTRFSLTRVGGSPMMAGRGWDCSAAALPKSALFCSSPFCYLAPRSYRKLPGRWERD